MENFYEAAVRHWIDGRILEENGEYDNAVCMQGFAAECALKEMLMGGFSEEEVRKYSHDGENLFKDLVMMLSNDNALLSVWDPSLGLKLSEICLFPKLFQGHPERRYYSDGSYSEEDARSCRESAELILQELFRLYLDGYMDN